MLVRMSPLFILFWSALADAEESAGFEMYKSAVIGAATVIGIVMLVGSYRLAAFAIAKAVPTAPVWLRTAAGLSCVVVLFLLISTMD